MKQLQTIVNKYWKEPGVALAVRARWHDILALKEKHCDFLSHKHACIYTKQISPKYVTRACTLFVLLS